MELLNWFDKGMTLEDYLINMKVNRSGTEHIYEHFRLTPKEKELLGNKKDKVKKAIVLTEDWCGDAMLNNPVLLRIAEELKIEVRFLLRDQNLELMDQYLTNGKSRSIPIFIFIDDRGEEKAVWGPRAATVQQYVDEERAKLPSQDDPEFAEKQKGMFRALMKRYQEDETLWHQVAESIIQKLR